MQHIFYDNSNYLKTWAGERCDRILSNMMTPNSTLWETVNRLSLVSLNRLNSLLLDLSPSASTSALYGLTQSLLTNPGFRRRHSNPACRLRLSPQSFTCLTELQSSKWLKLHLQSCEIMAITRRMSNLSSNLRWTELICATVPSFLNTTESIFTYSPLICPCHNTPDSSKILKTLSDSNILHKSSNTRILNYIFWMHYYSGDLLLSEVYYGFTSDAFQCWSCSAWN